nr:cytochrome c [Fertoeibacter niger]
MICAGGVSLAADAVEPTVKARQELMGVVAMNTKVLGDMAGGKTAFDAAAAEAAKTALAAAAAEIPAKFEPQATDPATKAKPEIWTNWADFTAKGAALGTAATAVDATTLEGVQAGMGAIGETCKSCHSAYRS